MTTQRAFGGQASFVAPQTICHKNYSAKLLLNNLAEQNKLICKIPVLIGSYAVHYFIPSIQKKFNDIDLIIDAQRAIIIADILFKNNIDFTLTVIETEIPRYILAFRDKNLFIFDIEIISSVNLSSFVIAQYFAQLSLVKTSQVNSQLSEYLGEYLHIASLSLLETLKYSHIFQPHNFFKNIESLFRIRRALVPAIDWINNSPVSVFRDNNLTRVLDLRRQECNQIYGVPGEHINLNQSNEDFLEKQRLLLVEKMIPHDDIHELVKFGEVPMYTRIKKDPSKAACSIHLFNQLTLEEKLMEIQEEACVLALERYLLPEYLHDEQQAYTNALKRICTTITKGWFRDFAVNHYELLLKCPKSLSGICKSIQHTHQQKQLEVYLNNYKNIYNKAGFDCLVKEFSEEEKDLLEEALSLRKKTIEVTTLLQELDGTNETNETKDSLKFEHQTAKLSTESYYSTEYFESLLEAHQNLMPWSNIVFQHQSLATSESLKGFSEYYSSYHKGYSLPNTSRYFYIKDLELFICVKTDHQFSCHDCSEELSWSGSVIIINYDKTKSMKEHKEHTFFSENFLVNARISVAAAVGTSLWNGNHCKVGVKFDAGKIRNRRVSFLLRYVCGLLNPHMVDGGEHLLREKKEHLVDHLNGVNFWSKVFRLDLGV